MVVGLFHYLVVAALLLVLGIFGIFLNRKNVIVILMSIELILLAVNINLVAFSTFLGDIVGQVLSLIHIWSRSFPPVPTRACSCWRRWCPACWRSPPGR